MIGDIISRDELDDQIKLKKEKVVVLYIDDEENNLNSFKASFRRDFTVHTTISAEKGLEVLENNKVHVIISDQRMPKMTGTEFFASIIEKFPNPIRILLTGYADINAVIDAINQGQVFKYIPKPWDENELRITINNAYEVFHLREENKHLMKNLMQANKQLEFLLRQKLLS